ncbi:hypothetical protein FRC02_009486 [Tulasnella sp. 418]|nr:hypothetical protein FRC02_009486 [Tulasnella sp. 418]
METSGSEEISRPSSPANSVISFSTDDVNILLREFGGRLLNSQNEMYVLPVDDREHARLDYQHRALTLTLDSLYAAPDLVRAVMTPSQKRSPAAVDLGAGSGQWVIEFAEEFPHATVVGIDLAPPTNFHKPIPSNCRFEVDDVNYSLSHYAKSFDVCHMRSIECGINDYEDLIYRVAQILRTNGVLLMASGGDQLYGEDRKPLPQEVAEGQPGWCAAQALFSATHSSGL